MELKRGDVFATRNPMLLGRAIRAVQVFWSRDGEAHYSHAGIITSAEGATLECLWTVRCQDLFEHYGGERVMVARYTGALSRPVREAIEIIEGDHLGDIYPVWRLLLHLLPPAAKINWSGRPVCSELVAKYLHLLGGRHRKWAGTNPDTLADEWRQWRDYEVVFEGEL